MTIWNGGLMSWVVDVFSTSNAVLRHFLLNCGAECGDVEFVCVFCGRASECVCSWVVCTWCGCVCFFEFCLLNVCARHARSAFLMIVCDPMSHGWFLCCFGKRHLVCACACRELAGLCCGRLLQVCLFLSLPNQHDGPYSLVAIEQDCCMD